jgi:sugar lactone lactonase YvrE
MKTLLAALSLVAGSAFAHPPVSVVLDARGNVYYSDLEQVWKIAPDGKKSVAVPNVHTHELYLDAAGNLYGEHLWYEGERINKWGHSVWCRDASGKVAMVVPRTEGFLEEYSFTRDAAGNMYWADHDRAEIHRITPGGQISVVTRGLKDMHWLHATPGGTLYTINGRDLIRIAPDGKVTRLARNLAGTSSIRPHVSLRHAIMGIWTDGAENVYLAHNANGKVLRVAPDGKVTAVTSSTWPWSPTGGAIAANGDLWLLETSMTNAVRVRRVKVK